MDFTTMSNEKITRKIIIKFFSEFLRDKLSDNHESFLKVVDFENFVVLKGKTTSKEVLDLSDVVGEFKKKFESIIPSDLPFNTIDLIEYDSFPNKFELEETNIIRCKI